MAKKANKVIKTGIKVRYNNRIWEVGYYDGTNVLHLFRFINHRTGEQTCIVGHASVNDVDVI